ncbi:MAG: hypothetical protein OEZ06_32430, partial [Myxococcales bacterium]|nr:hypothetical protein [Myxococcales bacterium]
AQLLTDQGSPYMAKQTLELLDALDVEHAPQREADPQGKATIERAFGTCKQMLEPLLSLTDRMAQALPQLADLDLARATVTVLMTLLLRAYQAGARAAHRADEQRGGLNEQALARAAAEQRDSARADDRSVRLLLTRIHGAYDLPGSPQAFIRPPTRSAPVAFRTFAAKRWRSRHTCDHSAISTGHLQHTAS